MRVIIWGEFIGLLALSACGANVISPSVVKPNCHGGTRPAIEAVIASMPNGTWGASGHGNASAEQCADGTWEIKVTE